MIEEIVYHQSEIVSAITIIFFTGLGLCVLGLIIMNVAYNLKVSLIPICIGAAMIFLIIPINHIDDEEINSWEEQVRQQIETLGCEDLQEAYEIYEMEYIQDKFINKCLEESGETYQWWLK